MGSHPPSVRDYWGYLIEPDKTPSPLLEQLLLGIAHYVTKHVAPWNQKCLSPPKLAAFYKLLGSDYDLIFLQTPPPSLAFIYKSLGCYHTLQPVKNPFAPPSIPALTPEGFVRWQTIQLLLGPAEHVPLLQAAVKRLDIINPADGVPFPRILPNDALPSRPDPGMTRWHDDVTNREFRAGPEKWLERRTSRNAENESSNDDSSISSSDERSRSRSPKSRSPKQARRRSRPDPVETTAHPRSNTHSPASRRGHNGQTYLSPSTHHQRRRSLPGEDAVSSRDGPTPTEGSYRRSPRSPRPTTPEMLSITDGSETADSSFETNDSPAQERHNFHEGPRPYYDAHGRRHSAHSPYDERDHVPQSQVGNGNTLSPPFFARGGGNSVMPATGHERNRVRSGSKAKLREESSGGAGLWSRNVPSMRLEGQDPGYFDDRPRRRPTVSGGGGRHYA